MTPGKQRIGSQVRQRQADVTIARFGADAGGRQQPCRLRDVGHQPCELKIERPQQTFLYRLIEQ